MSREKGNMRKKKLLKNLQELAQNKKNESLSSIAKSLLDDFFADEWHTAKEISEVYNVSEATISNYAKRLGFEGYQDLLWNLKYIRSGYNEEEGIPVNNDVIREYNQELIQQLSSNRADYSIIEKIINIGQKCQNIFIFSSYQLDDLAAYFVQLMSQKKAEIFHNPIKIYAHKTINRIMNNDLVLIFASGQDNVFLEFDFKLINNITNNIFVFASRSQAEIFWIENKTIELDLPNLPTTNHTRHLVLMYYMNLIYYLF